MLRITTLHGPEAMLLKLEGSIRGPWVSELQKAWSQADRESSVHVDLTGVSFADSKGRDVLVGMKRAGAVLTGASQFMRQILNEAQEGSAMVQMTREEN